MSAGAQEAARRYVRRGFAPIPLPAGSKNPGRPGWQELRITLEEIPRYFHNGEGVGLLLGEPSGGLVDVDADVPEAVGLAGRFLPPTLTSGRGSSPHSHWWYRSPGATTQKYRDADGTMLVELRSTGAQTAVQPSTHPSGEACRWHSETGLELEHAEAGELSARVRELASAALIARHLPVHREHGGGGRHAYALALSGFLLRQGRLDEGTTLKVLVAAWDAKGFPAEREKREAHRDLGGVVGDTAEKIGRGESVRGGPTLEEMVPKMTRTLARYWGWGAEPKTAPDPERNGHHAGILLSEVIPERVCWLWPGRIPLGKLTVIDGDPGAGKSAMTTDLAARVSVGRQWPDGGQCPAGGVVLCNAEDGLADTIRPRLDAAGGDSSRVLALSVVGSGDAERMLAIPEDLPAVRTAVERVGARLVIVDPIMAFLSGRVNAHRDQDVRRALAPFKVLAEQTGAAVVVVRHLNQATGVNALYRGQGSIGIVGAARSALLVGLHPDDDERRVVAAQKGNLAAAAPSLEFALVGSVNGAVRVEWKGECPLSADALLKPPEDEEERSAHAEAVSFLKTVLREGPVSAAKVKEQAKEAGVAERTLKRAKAALGIAAEKEGYQGAWVWCLPERESKGGHEPPIPPEDGTLWRNEAENGAKTPANSKGGHKGGQDREVGPLWDEPLGNGKNADHEVQRGPTPGRHGDGGAALPAESIGAALRRPNSGPSLALVTYLQKPGPTRLQWLTKSVLTARRMDTAGWERHAEAVRRAAEDPTNHAVGCRCEICP